jgi:tight adherence protein C
MPGPVPLLAAALAIVAIVLALQVGASVRHPITRRARRLVEQRRPSAAAQSWSLRGIVGRLHSVFDSLGLETPDRRRSLSEQLGVGGLRGPAALYLHQLALIGAPSLGVLVGHLLLPALMGSTATAVRFGGALCGLAAGAAAPKLWLKNRTVKRMAALERQLADALDLFVICVEAGLSLDAAIARVARDLGPAAPELAEELQMTAIELGFLPNRAEVFANLRRRAPVEPIRSLVNIFQQTERYGSPLADGLRVLAADYRTASLLKAEEKAARLPAVLTIPMILFVLPPLFVVLLAPAALQLMALRG